jgi:hypothetical protein
MFNALSKSEKALIEYLLEQGDTNVKSLIARAPCAPDWVKRALGSSGEVRVRVALAQSEIPLDVVDQLARDAATPVRAAVARRNDLTVGAVIDLATDDSSFVRSLVARHGFGTGVLLEWLSETSGEDVLLSLARNSTASPELLRAVSRRSSGRAALIAIERLETQRYENIPSST